MRDAEISGGVCRVLGLVGLYPQHIPLTKTFFFKKKNNKKIKQEIGAVLTVANHYRLIWTIEISQWEGYKQRTQSDLVTRCASQLSDATVRPQLLCSAVSRRRTGGDGFVSVARVSWWPWLVQQTTYEGESKGSRPLCSGGFSTISGDNQHRTR